MSTAIMLPILPLLFVVADNGPFLPDRCNMHVPLARLMLMSVFVSVPADKAFYVTARVVIEVSFGFEITTTYADLFPLLVLWKTLFGHRLGMGMHNSMHPLPETQLVMNLIFGIKSTAYARIPGRMMTRDLATLPRVELSVLLDPSSRLRV